MSLVDHPKSPATKSQYVHTVGSSCTDFEVLTATRNAPCPAASALYCRSHTKRSARGT